MEATSAMLLNTSVFPAQSTAAEAILLRCVLLLVSYLGGSMSIFSIYTKKDKPKYAYGIRWALRQSCDALDT